MTLDTCAIPKLIVELTLGLYSNRPELPRFLGIEETDDVARVMLYDHGSAAGRSTSGEWLPEPLLTSPDVAEDAELAVNVSIARR
jgi:hypothetical protein